MAKIPVQEIEFMGNRGVVVAVMEADAAGKFRFVGWEVEGRKHPGRKPGRRGKLAGRRGPKPGIKRGPYKKRKKRTAKAASASKTE